MCIYLSIILMLGFWSNLSVASESLPAQHRERKLDLLRPTRINIPSVFVQQNQGAVIQEESPVRLAKFTEGQFRDFSIYIPADQWRAVEPQISRISYGHELRRFYYQGAGAVIGGLAAGAVGMATVMMLLNKGE